MNGKSIATFALICLFASIKYAGCATIYILTSASNPCPSSAGAEQCTTLQQFASNPGQSVGSNLTMILENGTHALTTQFALNNLYNWTLITTDATILCSGMHYQLQFRSIEHIVIDGVTFQSCGYYSNIHNLGTSISIANSRFLDCGLLNIHSIADSVRFKNVYSRSSFAMSIRNVSKLTIENSTFENGQGHFTIDPAPGIATHMVITDSNFHGGTSEAIRCHLTQSSTVFISGCNFTSNLRGVYIRGAVTTLVNSNFTKNGYAYTSHWGDYSNISNCLFQGSYSGPATNLKGTMTDCLLVSNTRGALVSNDLVVIRTMFVNNTEEYRGAVLRNDVHVGSFTFIQCSFINNTALRETGGAIYFSWRNANLTLIDSTFHHNSAASCGALHVNDLDNYNMHVNIIGCTFTHNQATMELTGGGVACFENAFVSVQSSEFSHNSAALHCGVFCAENSTINVSECTFINNSAAYDGGVFYGVINPSIYNITRSVFAQNRAYDDGGVMYLGQSGNLATITSSNFTMNAATDRGGVVALTASTFQIFQSNMINNTANKGSSINACNAAIIAPDDLQNTTDPTNFMCTLYNGNMNNFNTSTPTNEVLSTPLIPPSSEVFSTAHIYVSADSTCPGEYTGEPCYSLEQFATDSSRDSSITRRNLTLLFEDGIHKLTSQMRIENFYNLTMVANSATILCSGMHYQLQFRSIEHIVIDGVTFQSCGYYSNIHNLGTSTSIANSRFLDCGLLSVHSIADSVRFTNVYSRSSFAMSIRNVSKLTIENSTFEYGQGHFTIDPAPRIATHMVITDSNFHGGTSEAIRCHLTQSSTVYISGCNFTSNLRGVYIRGAVTTLVNSNFTNNGYAYTSHWGDYSNITNCLFQGSYSGRAANLKGTMTDCLLVSNTRGALVSNDLVVTRTMFANNTEEYRGAVLSNDVHVGSFTFIQCSFINNTCTSIQGTGGVIYFSWRNANLTLIDSIFHHNSAASCGALHVNDLDNYNMHVNIIGCTFTHNQATMELTGGGAACFENAFVSVQSSEFNHNSAALHGGALVIENSTVTMDKSIFLNNSATVDGGVIYNNLFSTSYNIKRCVFSHSSAGDDGGVMYMLAALEVKSQ